MPSVDSDLVESLFRHDEYLTARELLRYLERRHPVEGPGVPRDLAEAYAEALDDDADRFASSLDDRVTDARTLQPGERVFEVDGTLSYPASWHEHLADTTDLSGYAEVMPESGRLPEDRVD
ncbi:hypothetical protein [Halorussus litoreus]|uniref:hypothetical protein n=1 Tax=Halorussus litoreus TaxID=1710536 RepID=UPI000E267FD8|nr:hypothetical protein [Halorussus litoreus]